jgi:hypothetical protein
VFGPARTGSPHPITVVGMRLFVVDFNADMYRMLRSVAEAQQTSILPVLQIRQAIERTTGARLQEMVNSVFKAQRTTIAPVLQVQQVMERAARGPVQELISSMAETRRTTILPVLQVQQAIERAAGAQIQEMVGTLLTQQIEVRPLLDTQRMAEIAQGILESSTTDPGEPTTDGGLASAAVALPGNAPLFPGLANPWQQVRNWELKDWVGFFLTVVTILLAVLALRAPRGLTPQEVEQIIRTVQESARTSSTTPTATTVAPSTTTSSTTPASTTVGTPDVGRRSPTGPALRSAEKVVTSSRPLP